MRELFIPACVFAHFDIAERELHRFLNLTGYMFEQSHPLKGMTINDARTQMTPFGLLMSTLNL